MRSYPKYKPSGVDWLGEIPSEFNIISLKNLVKVKVTDGPHETPTAVEDGIPFISAEAIQNFSINFDSKWGYITKEDHLKYSKKCSPKNGDIFIVKSGATTGKVAYVDTNIEFNIWSPLALIRADEKIVYSRYLFYFIISQFFQEQIQFSWSFGTQQNIGMGVIQNLQIVISSLSEQQQIVDFLDYKTGQCDRFIANRQKQIELLNEQKAAIINKAVTKGINPNAKMKPSGIEWIGDIPEHWECMKIKRLSVVKRGASPRPIDDPKYFDENGEFAWVRIADVTASERYLENTTQRLSKLGSSLSVKMYPNDFFLSIAGSVGKPIITKIKCCIHDGFVWFPYLKINHEFLYYLFSTGLPYQGLGKFGTQLNLNTDTVGDIFLPIPTADEMTIIVSFIDNQTQKIDYLISKYQKQIELMQEYRTALISQAVTGKIDVRDWKPQTK